MKTPLRLLGIALLACSMTAVAADNTNNGNNTTIAPAAMPNQINTTNAKNSPAQPTTALDQQHHAPHLGSKYG